MKYIFTFLIALVCSAGIAQQVGSKVSFSATDGKTYTGTIKEIQGTQYKIKYDGFDFEAWLAANQFTVTDANNQPADNLPAMPQAMKQMPPDSVTQTTTEIIPQTTPENIPQNTPQTGPQNMGNTNTNTNTNTNGTTRSDSLKMAYNNIKNAFGAFNKLFAAKRDTMTITIPEIDYDNSSLAQLKEKLHSVRGVKSVTMHYKSSTAVMEISFKGKATDVWDNLPAATRSAFKILELTDNSILLKQK